MSIVEYNFQDHIKPVSNEEIKYSNGFLKAKIENWFPKISDQWESFFINLNIDFKFQHIDSEIVINSETPSLSGIIESEAFKFGLKIEDSLSSFFKNHLASKTELTTFKQYVTRRILNSLLLSWNSFNNQESSFTDTTDSEDNIPSNWVAKVNLYFRLNGIDQKISFYLNESLTDNLNALWLKQLRSRSTQTLRAGVISFEIASKFIESKDFASVLKNGSTINVDQEVSNKALLLYEGRPWLPAEIFYCNNNFVAKISSGSQISAKSKGSMIRLSFELASHEIDPITALEVNQRGAFIKSEIEVGDIAIIKVNKEEVGKAKIYVDSGNYLFEVI